MPVNSSLQMGTKILIIDHNDSFTYNLVQLLEEAGAQEVVVMPVAAVKEHQINSFDGIILSPGPGLPGNYLESFSILKKYAAIKPILGVCLGLQIIVEFFGGQLQNLNVVQHGRQLEIYRQIDCLLFEEMNFPFKVGLYHSWAMDKSINLECLQITSVLKNGTVMSLRHSLYKIYAVQFHPESYMTQQGLQLMKNWLKIVEGR
ncbi:anthranilate synthase component II [Arachidicoccus sp.]|uniref:anthranilate synthase component II n=1 Tax=Arachidicoccus sp. TaxID=1872624 RepID=UPI003D233FC1